MPSTLSAAIKRIGIAIAGIAAFLASVSGVIAAVQWAIDAFGVVSVLVVAAFVAGAVIMHGVDHARAIRGERVARSP